MKIEDIKPGKKYYHRITINGDDRMTGKKRKQLNTMFVVEVDLPGKRVCASANGLPATWYKQIQFCRWKAEDPNGPKKCTWPRSFEMKKITAPTHQLKEKLN